MLINLLEQLKKLYSNGGICNLNNRNLIQAGIYNDIMILIKKEKIKYDILEYCSILIDKYDDYIHYISICND